MKRRHSTDPRSVEEQAARRRSMDSPAPVHEQPGAGPSHSPAPVHGQPGAGPSDSPAPVHEQPGAGPLDGPAPVHGQPGAGPSHRKRLRAPIDSIEVGRRALAKETALYVTRVHRLGEGDTFTAFDPERAIEADAHIVEIGARSVTVQIDGVRPAEVVAPRAVTLVQALGKGDKLDAIVRDATELGAVRIVPVIAERSVVRPADVAGRAQRWRRIAVEAARQCGRGDVPQIDAPTPLIEAVDRSRSRARTHACDRSGSYAHAGRFLGRRPWRAGSSAALGRLPRARGRRFPR